METLKIKIGDKEKEVYAEEIYCKLLAIKESYRALMQDFWHTKLTPPDDLVIAGMDYIFRDVLSEVDQLFLDGQMEEAVSAGQQFKAQEPEGLKL